MNTTRILMLEDDPIDVDIIRHELSKSSLPFHFTIVGSGKEYISKLEEEEFDLILCDFRIPRFDGIKALQVRNRKNSSIPFILITGVLSEAAAVNLVKEGADDYILKDRMQRLPVAVEKLVRKKKVRTDKESLTASLFELTQRFQIAAKTSSDIIWDYNIERGTIYCSDAVEKIIGINLQEDFKPSYIKKFLHPDDWLAVERSLLQVLKGKDNRWRKIFRLIRKDGNIAWVNNNALVIRNDKEQAVRIVGVMQDVTEVRKLQHELVEKETAIQREITEIAVQAQEKERMEIGKELHDNVNQLLATAKIMIDTARNSPELHDLCLTKSQESIIEALTELRNLAHSMMPPPFEFNSFEDIIMDLVFKVNLTGKVNLDVFLPPKEQLEEVHNKIKLIFYRIIQEQVSNILKHSKAKNVSISLRVNENDIILAIEDDGIGFQLHERAKGIGLRNIESRASLVNGTMNIITAPGEGCLLQVRVPVGLIAYV